eukprot:CCRYP_006390-RA/>CCRYP_006390-RA protein AED:0.02 eAED:0.02 QI:411/1/1/1/1/1/5/578/1448
MRPSSLRWLPPSQSAPTATATSSGRRIRFRPSRTSSSFHHFQSPSFRPKSTVVIPHKQRSFHNPPPIPPTTTNQRQRQPPPSHPSSSTLEALANRLAFFFSDVNLRHDSYARSILSQHHHQYLPLSVVLSFRSIRRYTHDAEVVLLAMEWVNARRGRREREGGGKEGEERVQLESLHDERGQLVLGRTVPYHHGESLQRSYEKIMIVEGWPVEENTQWVESRVRSFLCSRPPPSSSSTSSSPQQYAAQEGYDNHSSSCIAYWNKNVPLGIITMEFTTLEGARCAWDNLHRSRTRNTHDTTVVDNAKVHPAEIVVRSSSCDAKHVEQRDKRYNVFVGGLSLVVREMTEEELEGGQVVSSEERMENTLPTVPISKETSGETTHHSSLEEMASNTSGSSNYTVVPEQQERSAISNSKPDKWWHNESAAPSLSQCTDAMNQFYNQHRTLPPPPREWLHEQRFNKRGGRHNHHHHSSSSSSSHHAKYPWTSLNDQQWRERTELCANVAGIVSRIRNSIDRGVIRALGAREAYAMSDFIRRAMLILSECPPPTPTTTNPTQSLDDDSSPTTISPYNACLEAFDILRSLNLDFHPHHYSYAIRCACHESRWEEAANIFLRQIIHGEDAHSSHDDGQTVTTGGFVPVDPTLGWDRPLEVGLYAVAVDAWFKLRKSYAVDRDDDDDGDSGGGGASSSDDVEWGVSPSKKVFDTAMKMSMIAPSGQESYVLAAGCALGRAGLWSDCLDFATDQNNLSKFGPSLVAAAMLTCIESSRSAEAVDVYNYFLKSENQNTASEWQWAGGTFSAAKPLFDDLLLRAMGGVSGGGYSGAAIQKFCDMVDNDIPFSGDALIGLMHSIEHDGDWQSSIKLLEAFCDSHFRKSENKWRLVNGMLGLNGADMEEADAPTKAHLQDILSKLLASTMRICNREGHFGLAMLVCSIANSCVDTRYNFELSWPDDDSTTKTIMSQKLLGSKPVLDAYLQSLHRVGLRRLVNTISNEIEGADISSNSVQNYSPVAESWIKAFTTTNRVLIALNDIRRTKTPLSDEDRGLISRGIATAMNFCIDANQPASAIHLFAYANNSLAPKRSAASFRETVLTFFGDTRSEPDTASKIFLSQETFDFETLSLCDSLLSAVIRAYTMMGQPEKAFAVFESVTSQENYQAPSQDTIQSFNAALEVLLENNPEKFMSLFEDTNSDFLMPSTFLAVARSYARKGAWPEIGEVYNKARRRGCVSEEIGFIAMQAVCEAELLDGKITVLRKIADDISNTIGMKTEEWISSQYWYIKRYAGFHYARLLMNWDTPATSQKEELLFAINEMRRCKSQGVLTKNAPLFCIVKQGEIYASSDGSKNLANVTESQRRSAINIIFEACAEAQLSGLIKRPAFTAEVVRSLRALKGDKQCIQFVKTLIANEERCPHKIAMEYAIRAASEVRDFESLDMLVTAFEKSGYDSQSLSM